jgi:hypothetical protein
MKVALNEQAIAKLKEIREIAEKLVVACDQLIQILTPSQTPPVAPVPKPASSITDELQKKLEPALFNLLAITESQGMTIVKPKAFLGTDNFIKLAAAVRELGGEYVSAGKESHFKIIRKA